MPRPPTGARRLHQRRPLRRRPRAARHRPGRARPAEPELAELHRRGLQRRRLRRGPGKAGGALPGGQGKCRLVREREATGAAPLHPRPIPYGRLPKLRVAGLLHPVALGASRPCARAPAAARARSPRRGQGAAGHAGGQAALCVAPRRRGGVLASRARFRVAPSPLPRAGQDRPAAPHHCRRAQPPPSRRLARGPVARAHVQVTLHGRRRVTGGFANSVRLLDLNVCPQLNTTAEEALDPSERSLERRWPGEAEYVAGVKSAGTAGHQVPAKSR